MFEGTKFYGKEEGVKFLWLCLGNPFGNRKTSKQGYFKTKTIDNAISLLIIISKIMPSTGLEPVTPRLGI